MDFLHFILGHISSHSRYLPFFLILAIVGWLMHRAHISDSKFTVYDMLTNSITGKADVEKIFLVLGSLSVTWWFMDLSVQHTATWSDAVAYGGLLGLAKVANKALELKYPQQPDSVKETQ